jgi:hypothetical protein
MYPVVSSGSSTWAQFSLAASITTLPEEGTVVSTALFSLALS